MLVIITKQRYAADIQKQIDKAVKEQKDSMQTVTIVVIVILIMCIAIFSRVKDI